MSRVYYNVIHEECDEFGEVMHGKCDTTVFQIRNNVAFRSHQCCCATHGIIPNA